MWKKVDIDSKEVIDSYTKNKFRINDFSFTNLFLWSYGENMEYEEEDGVLTIRGYYCNNEYYFMPLVKGINEESIKKIKEKIRKILSENKPIGYFTEEFKNILEGDFNFLEDRDYFDYVYLVEDLAHLKGRKYSKKRNRINLFLKNYNYSYENINSKNVNEVLEFQKKWYENHISNLEEKEILKNETVGIENILKNFDKLDVKGGVLRVDGEIVAYTIGELISPEMVVIHVEKAMTEFSGSYQAINSLFLQNEFLNIKYVNREDDFGDEGLREAKQSYYPCELIKKYSLT